MLPVKSSSTDISQELYELEDDELKLDEDDDRLDEELDEELELDNELDELDREELDSELEELETDELETEELDREELDNELLDDDNELDELDREELDEDVLDDETELELDEDKKSIPLTSKVTPPLGDFTNNLLISFPTNVAGNTSFDVLIVSTSPIMTFPLLSQT